MSQVAEVSDLVRVWRGEAPADEGYAFEPDSVDVWGWWLWCPRGERKLPICVRVNADGAADEAGARVPAAEGRYLGRLGDLTLTSGQRRAIRGRVIAMREPPKVDVKLRKLWRETLLGAEGEPMFGHWLRGGTTYQQGYALVFPPTLDEPDGRYAWLGDSAKAAEMALRQRANPGLFEGVGVGDREAAWLRLRGRRVPGRPGVFEVDPADLPPFDERVELLPVMTEPELDALARAIESTGQRDPIVVWNGRIIDGRHRVLACQRLGRPVLCREFSGSSDDADVEVFNANVARRQLSQGQRAMVIERFRSLRGSETLAKVLGVAATSEAIAAASDVGERTLRRAAAVQRDGVPELQDAAARGEVPLDDAAALAGLPAPAQRELLDQLRASPEGREAITRVAREQRAEKRRTRLEAQRAEAAAKVAALTSEGVDAGERWRLIEGDVEEYVRGATERYQVIHMDGPWEYDRKPPSGDPGEQYANEWDVERMVRLVLATYEVAADNAVLLVWTTNPHLLAFAGLLDRELALLEGKSWRYVSKRTMRKSGKGIGHWFTGDDEPVLLFVKGKPPLWTAPPSSVADVERAAHSRKDPGFIFEMIRAFCPPGGAVLDLFAGTASCGEACVRANVPYLGIDNDPARLTEGQAFLLSAVAEHRSQVALPFDAQEQPALLNADVSPEWGRAQIDAVRVAQAGKQAGEIARKLSEIYGVLKRLHGDSFETLISSVREDLSAYMAKTRLRNPVLAVLNMNADADIAPGRVLWLLGAAVDLLEARQ